MQNELDKSGCTALIAGIIEQAVRDWRKAERMLGKVPDDKKSLEMKMECEEFFRSEWYSELREMLEEGIPEDILKVLEEEK